MKDKRQHLMDQVSGLPDAELLHILDGETSDYRFETIVYAKAEADKRGLSYSQADMAGLNSPLTQNFTDRLIRIFRSHIFGIGFLVTLALFVFANYLNYTHVSSGLCDDCFLNYGFPFPFYQSGGFAGGSGLSLTGLALDVAISLSLSIAFGLSLRRMLGSHKRST